MREDRILVTKTTLPAYENYINAIKPLWDSRWITNMGCFHDELQERLKEYLGVKYVSLTCNGHMALELSLQAFDFPAGSEVITTPFTFVSTTNAIVRSNLVPVFCDVKREDGTIDESKIEALITDRTVALLPIHVYGNMCNNDAIQEIAKRYNIKVIYDAAHSFGIKRDDAESEYGDASIFSFHATKVFNTVEGGCVVCNDKALYDKICALRNFGIEDGECRYAGPNGKMNEFSAVMGLCNLDNIENTIKEREVRYNHYIGRLSGIEGIRILRSRHDSNNYCYLPIIVEDSYPMTRNELFNLLRKYNIYARRYFYPDTAMQAAHKGKYADDGLKVSHDLSERVLALPLYADIEFDVIDEIVDIIKEQG